MHLHAIGIIPEDVLQRSCKEYRDTLVNAIAYVFSKLSTSRTLDGALATGTTPLRSSPANLELSGGFGGVGVSV
jgi:hypothetical protein